MTPFFFDPDLNIDAEEFRQYLPVNASINFDSLAPALGAAEQKHIKPALGDANFQLLADAYAANTSDDEKCNLIEKIQAAVIRIAFFENFDLLAVTLTDTGIQDMNGDTRAYRYQAEAAKVTLGRQAYEYLQFFFDAYLASSIYTPPSTVRSTLFPDYRSFFGTLALEPDFRLFAKLLPMIEMTERITLPAAIGKPLAEELLSGQGERMKDIIILGNARYMVANDVMAQSVMTLHAYISDDGATTRTIKAEGTNGGTNHQLADRATRVALQQSYSSRAENGRHNLLDFLVSHAEQYPEILPVATEAGCTRFTRQGKKTFRTF